MSGAETGPPSARAEGAKRPRRRVPLFGLTPATARRRLVGSLDALPPAGWAGGSLGAVVAIMCWLACLAGAAGLTAAHVADVWTGSLVRAATVEVQPEPGVDVDARLEEIMRVLRLEPGIDSARPLPASEVAALLAPWLGEGVAASGLPMPGLIELTLAESPALDFEGLQTRITAVAPGARLDDHGAWRERVSNLAALSRGVALGAMALIAAAAMAVAGFAARAELEAHREVVDILHTIGADDGYVAGAFTRRAWRLGLTAGAIGLFGALVTLLIARERLGIAEGDVASAFSAELTPSLAQFGWLAVAPLAFGALSALAARLTVARALARLV